MTCEDCKQEKEDVKERLCPYAYDINNEEVLVVICDDCSHERAMDI